MNNKNFEDLLAIRSQVEQIIFKGFLREYKLPKGIKQVHAETMLQLKRYEFMSMSELSYALNMEKASITTIADKLVASGYITSERSTTDRRVYHLRLTDQGTDFVLDYGKNHIAYIDSLFEELSERKRDELFEAVHTVTESFSALSVVKTYSK